MKLLSLFVLVLTALCGWNYKFGSEAQLFSAATVLEQRLMAALASLGLTGVVDAVAFNNPVLVPTTQSLLLASADDAYYYMQYAAIAYCHGSPLLMTWTCKYCKKLRPDVRLIAELYNSTTQIAGMINVNEVRQEIMVTFRGTWALSDVVLDLDVVPMPIAGVNEAVQVHQG